MGWIAIVFVLIVGAFTYFGNSPSSQDKPEVKGEITHEVSPSPFSVASPILSPTPSPILNPNPKLSPSPAVKTIPTYCPNGTYINVYGNEVCSPYSSPTAPAGASAICNDRTYSFSQSRRGTCSHHGGVARWL